MFDIEIQMLYSLTLIKVTKDKIKQMHHYGKQG